MKCPSCGSEQIQFGTNTKGTGFSAGDACCGFIILGPLGILCGACGNDIKTDEFWICQNCGNKFSNSEAQRLHKIEEESRRNYEQNKKEYERALREHGNRETIEHRFRESQINRNITVDNFNVSMEQYVKTNLNDPEISKLYKIMNSDYSKPEIIMAIILAIVALISFIGGAIGIGIISVIFIGALCIARPLACLISERKLSKLLLKKNPKLKDLYFKAKRADNEYERWYSLISKINSCEEYERKKGTK